MTYVYKVVLAILMLTVLVALTACGPKSRKVKDYTITGDISGLELDESQAPTLVYTRPGAPSLAAYNRFIIDPVQVNYSDPKMKELDPEQVGEMQQYFRDAMIKELREAGYEVGTRSQAETLRISLTIAGLKAPRGGGAANVATMAAGAVVRLPMIFAVSVGEVTVEGVFRDALTNRIDAVVVGRSQGSRTFKAKPWSTWADVKGTFNKWAKGVREAIDKAHGR
ncbi:MAG: DUF3313 family protein [Candidatus Tectomicrobia bacterium]